ncbi:MAG: hypothetical protein EOO71_02080 [Myxococcaceae bacterium]|nr:MAG: hypothetical protein EOO71_02080 [Myxococcaceae bacterium]
MTISTRLTLQNNSGCPIEDRGTPDDLEAGDGDRLVTSVDIVLGKQPTPDLSKTLDGWVFNAMTLDVSNCIVQPTGAPYSYSRFIFNAEGAVQVDVSFPG